VKADRITQKDLDGYCAAHVTDAAWEDAQGITLLPREFNAEAEALGASVTRSPSGFTQAAYLYTDPSMLRNIRFSREQFSQANLKIILDSVEKAAASRTVILKVSAPYSVLASLVEPSLFYRWLKKEAPAVHGALEKITLGLAEYIGSALLRGARIISLADPYGNLTLLGEDCYRSYAAAWLARLLEILEGRAGGLIHLCPHCSVPLETYGYLRAEASGRNGGSYVAALKAYSASGGVRIAGHRCIYTAANQAPRFFTVKRSTPCPARIPQTSI
jgi:uroporphyrinogen-III decarboxylase